VINYHNNQEAAEAVREHIVSEGGQAITCRFDVAVQQEVDDAVQELTRTVGTPQILVNNAAIIQDYLLMRMPDSAWHQVIETNLHGVYYCTKAVLRSMAGKRRPGRRIINMTSVAAEMGNVGQANYTAAKAGVIGLTKTLARELAPLGMTVNAIAPGAIDTEAIKHLDLAEMLKKIPLGRLGFPEEVAYVVSFLASELAGYVTGQVIRVNGGLLM
jgi:3-oxoacyl-[acyl-carrier protein] reductase